MQLLEYLYVLSDVQVSKICIHDILFRWFIGLDITERIPDNTTLVKFRNRLKEEGFREIFDELVRIANKEGFIKGKLRAIDATHIFSDTIKPGPIALINKESNKRSNIELVKSKTHKIKKSVEKGIVDNIRTLVNALENVVEGNSLQIVSFSDPDAKWGRKSSKKIFGGYKIHTTCATSNGFVDGVAGDKIYDSGGNRKYLKERKKKEIYFIFPQRIVQAVDIGGSVLSSRRSEKGYG